MSRRSPTFKWARIALAHRKQLVKAYDQFNRRYWEGKLPHSDDIFLHLIPAGQYGEVLSCTDFGGCSRDEDGKFTIEVRWQTDLSFRYSCLLHEMIHVAIWDRDEGVAHGRVWDEEVARISALGALQEVI